MSEAHPRIGGRAVATPEHDVVLSPYDGRELARVPRCGPEQVDDAVAAGVAALARPLPPWRRAEVLEAAAASLERHRDELAGLISAEAAKPIRTARTEATRAVDTFRAAAVEARTLAGEVVPMEGYRPGDGKLAFTLRVPRGVVGAITPFNFPLNLVAHKVAPAVAAGCPVVVKPAGRTPLSAIRLQELLLDECGLPPEWFAVVPGPGGTVGDRLATHPDVAAVTFTGSPEVGWGLAARATGKHVGLELGNNTPVIVEASGDWRRAAAAIAVAGNSHAGQSCISTQRVYVDREVAEPFVAELVARVDALVVGDPAEEATDLSALIDPEETRRVAGWVDDAVAAGAELATGGGREGRMLRPTVLTGVRPDMAVSCREVFGPVIAVATHTTLDEALALANDTRYGLQAGIFTGDLASALRAAHELDFGAVVVNEVPTFRSDQMPYGGVRDSGNTKEGPRYAVRELTRERLVVIER